MSANESVDNVATIDRQNSSFAEGSNQRFLNSNHTKYDNGDDSLRHEQNQDQGLDQSLQNYLMPQGVKNTTQKGSQSGGNTRGNRGNRNNNVQEVQEEKPSPTRRRGRGNRSNQGGDKQEKQEHASLKQDQQKDADDIEQDEKSADQLNSDSKVEDDLAGGKKQTDDQNDQEDQKQEDIKNEQMDDSDWNDIEANNQKQDSDAEKKSSLEKDQKLNIKLDESDWNIEVDNQKEANPTRAGRDRQRNSTKNQQENQLEPDKQVSKAWDDSIEKPKEENEPRNERRGNRGNRGNREGQQSDQQNDRNYGFQRNRYSDNNYQNRGRGENNYRNNRYDEQGRENNQGQNRGGYRNDNRGGYRGNNRGGFRGGRDDRNENQQGGFRNDRNGRNFQKRQRQQENEQNNTQKPESKNQNQQSSVKTSSPIYDAVPVIEPKGMQSWPEISFYVRKCKLSITFRTINENKADTLVFPIEDLKFRLYPSTLINYDSKINYRKKVQEKFEKGHFTTYNYYAKKNEPLGNFRDLIFWKVATNQEIKCNEFLLTLFQYLRTEPKSQSVVFPICKQLGKFEEILSAVIECLHSLVQHKKQFIKKFEFTTKDSEYFKQAGKVFWEKITEHIDSSKIYIL